MRNQGVFPPSRFGRYRGKVTQSSTDAPVLVTPVENTLNDNFVIARTSAGLYTLTKTGLFKAGKTFVLITPAPGRHYGVTYTSEDVVTIQFNDLATPTAADSGNFDLQVDIYD